MVFPRAEKFCHFSQQVRGEAIPRCGEILLGFRYNAFFPTRDVFDLLLVSISWYNIRTKYILSYFSTVLYRNIITYAY